LSGDGVDEPFGGYDWTRFVLTLPGFSLNLQPPGWQRICRKGSAGLIQQLIYDLANTENERYQRRVAVSEALRAWLYQPEFLHPIDDTLSLSTVNKLRRASVCDERDRFMYADLCRYLSEDDLYKVDRMSMANSLEVRVPLLDHRLLEWILRLPFGLRFRHDRGKYLLRKLAARYLPSEVLKHRKQELTVPLGRWLYCKLNDWLEDLFRSQSFKQRGIVRPQAALEMLAMHRNRRYELGHWIWSLVILEAWARVWLDGRHPDEVLSVE
jgi:asparagine synthetase B (glutamine-hydrolysing)